MKDIEIKISQETRMVDLKKMVIGNDSENLQGNLIFSFTDNFVNGTARLEYEINGNKKYIMLEKKEETYITPIKSVLTKKGQINMQLVITEGTSENDIPIFKSNIFYVFCNQSINAEIEQPDEYPSWIEIANSKINEIDEAILGVEEAKKYAIEKGDYAKEQGDYAKSQGDYAKEQKIEVVKANEEANRIINNFETNVGEYTTAFNENANNKTNDFDSNAESKTSDFNQNVDNKISEYNNNASDKLSAYNANAENKKSDFDTNVANQTKTFNDNATNKTNAFNINANSKTETYNNNHTEKLNAYNTNATSKLNDYNTNADTKLQEYNTNADNKIAEYDLHSQELDNKIIATRNELERVKNDVLETGTDTDTYIHLEDSAMAEYQELSVDGVCEQETTTGKNLLNNTLLTTVTTLNGVTATPNKDGSITLNGTATSITFMNLSRQDFGTNNLISGSLSSADYVASIGIKNSGLRMEYSGKNNYTYLRIESDAIFNNAVVYPMIRPASITDDTYEPYTGGQPSPSPDYPQPISTIENSLKITSCNKNLFDKDTITKRSYVLNDGTLQTETSYEYNTSDFIPVEPNTTYYKTLTLSPRTKFYDANKQVLSSSTYQDIAIGGNVGAFTTPANAYYLRFTINTNVSTGVSLDSVMVHKGSTATSYEQHLETQITANLPEGEFIGKINDTYKDELKVEYNETDGQYHLNLYKGVGKDVLDGSETISYNSSNQVFYTNIDNVDSKNNFIPSSNYFIGQSKISSFNELQNNKISFRVNTSSLFLKNTNITTVADLKTWLSTHPTEVYYALATPYVVDLGVVDQLITYNEITNLFTDSDLLPQINAKYYRNFISTVRNLQVNEKALKQELVDINTRLSALESASANIVSESEVIE